MSVATTPSQIKKECSGVPTRGTIVGVVTQSSTTIFIVAMDLQRVLTMLRGLVTSCKTWQGAVLGAIMQETPTCPVPKKLVKELQRFVEFTTYTDTLEWTEDGWGTTKSCHYDKVSQSWVYKS